MARPRRRVAARLCTTCRWQVATTGGRCATCHAYRKRTGRERTPDVIAAHCRRLAGPAPEPQLRLPIAG